MERAPGLVFGQGGRKAGHDDEAEGQDTQWTQHKASPVGSFWHTWQSVSYLSWPGLGTWDLQCSVAFLTAFHRRTLLGMKSPSSLETKLAENIG